MGFFRKSMTILMLACCSALSAQSQDQQMAKRYFDRTFYSEAIPIYEKLVARERSLEVVRNLADSYYFTGDFAKARQWYTVLLRSHSGAVGPEYTFRYVQTLKTEGSYKEANDTERSYLLRNGLADKAAKLDKDIEVLEDISAIGPRFTIRNLPLNTKFSEFGMTKNGLQMVFSGVKRPFGLLDKKFKWNDERYLDLLTIAQPEDTLAVGYAEAINTDLHEANAVFTHDGKTVYFTRNLSKNGKRGRNKEKVSVVQLFRADYEEGWVRIVPLPFNSDDFSVEHPALSADEKTLYFASDRPGGLGSFDIWSVPVNGGAYGDPVNLGAQINTDKREQFPFVSKDGKLYFSSDGHYGYGALDVFVSDEKGLFNIGLPVNGGYDDFAFSIDSGTKEGWFASNRPGGKGGDDIYALTETKPLVIEGCKQFIAGVISDVDTRLPLDKATVILRVGGQENDVEQIVTGPDGAFRFTVGCEGSYAVYASREAYSKDSRNVKLKKERNKINDASMALKSDAVVAQQKKEAEEAAQQEAEAKKKQRVADIMAKEKDVVKDRDRLIIKTDPIYFDYDLWYIRKDSRPILDRVVELMKKYPEMVVEIGSHTDVRGTVRYNRELSSKRAESTLDYIIGHGIPAPRISAKGYGESQQIVKCVPDESCSEEQHELNRRSEFVIKNL